MFDRKERLFDINQLARELYIHKTLTVWESYLAAEQFYEYETDYVQEVNNDANQ